MILTIGSGDISYLTMSKDTKGYQDLLRRFVAEYRPYWNSFASPIDALRTGAILEINYLKHLPDGYIFQKKVEFEEMDVFVSSIDFAKIENGKVVDFDELKTIFLTDYIDLIIPFKDTPEEIYLPMIKKNFKKNYNQIQAQLMCAKLKAANLVFMSATTYEDDENEVREISEKDYVKFRINRDEDIISEIKEKGKFFQMIKDNFKTEKKQKKKKATKKTETLPKTDEIVIDEVFVREGIKEPEIEPEMPEISIVNSLLDTTDDF